MLDRNWAKEREQYRNQELRRRHNAEFAAILISVILLLVGIGLIAFGLLTIH